MTDAIARLHARASRIRARRALVQWELRQELHAKGAFTRLARALSRAEVGFEIDEPDEAALIVEGWPRDEAGCDVSPEKSILWVSPERASQLTRARALEMRIDVALLGARRIALVPFAVWANLARRA